jgi:hypothetical protein
MRFRLRPLLQVIPLVPALLFAAIGCHHRIHPPPGGTPPPIVTPELDEHTSRSFESDRAAQLEFWEKRLKESQSTEERTHIQEIIDVIRRDATTRAVRLQSLVLVRTELGFWAGQVARARQAIEQTLGLLPLPGDLEGNPDCSRLKQQLALDEANLAYWQSHLNAPGAQQAIALLNSEIPWLEEQIQYSCPVPLPPPVSSKDVLTQHNGNDRTGAYLAETVLTPESVKQPARFGRLFARNVDGDVYAQPLYVSNLEIPGKGTRNVVFVATESDSVYAFDADNAGDGTPIWHVNLGSAIHLPSSFMSNTVQRCQETLKGGSEYNMSETGITSTPVIDRRSNTLYVVAVAEASILLRDQPVIDLATCTANPHGNAPGVLVTLFALDLATGARRRSTVISATAEGTGIGWIDDFGVHATDAVFREGRQVLRFDATKELPRPALLLTRGTVFVAFGSYMDIMPYHGWVMAYDAASLQQLGVFVTTANDGAGGIWQAGQGLAADPDGYVYAMTGNGGFNADKGGANVSDSFVKLSLDRNVTGGSSLRLVDWFASFWNDFPQGHCTVGGQPTTNCIASWDADQGSAGPVLIPGTHQIVGGGKLGRLYQLSTGNLGHFQDPQTQPDAMFSQVFRATKRIPECRSGVDSHIHGSPVFWGSSQGNRLYVWGEDDFLKSYALDTWQAPGRTISDPSGSPLEPRLGVPIAQSAAPAPCGMPGGILSLSAHGDDSRTGIVWATHPREGDAVQQTQPGVLEAYDAADLTLLWSSKTSDPKPFMFGKFNPPTIANGKVFIGTFASGSQSAQLIVYGLKAQ